MTEVAWCLRLCFGASAQVSFDVTTPQDENPVLIYMQNSVVPTIFVRIFVSPPLLALFSTSKANPSESFSTSSVSILYYAGYTESDVSGDLEYKRAAQKSSMRNDLFFIIKTQLHVAAQCLLSTRVELYASVVPVGLT